MINFIQSAFIRKNTSELRRKLEKLGYSPSYVSKDENLCIATSTIGSYRTIESEKFDSTNPNVTWNCSGRIDCGTNEDLFLALAALRNDSDKGQWFVCYKQNFSKTSDILRKMVLCLYDNAIYFFDDIHYIEIYHKATVEELIKHFKNEK